MKTIQSRDNPFAKQLISLAHSARDRKKSGLSVLDGVHLVEAYIHAMGAPRAVAVAASNTMSEIDALLAHLPKVETYVLPDSLIAEASALDSPATVMAIIETPKARAVPPEATAVLVLEEIQDPGNVGSMLRSAAAAGIRDVVLSKGCAFAWSPKVLRAAQGAHFSLNIVEGADAVKFVSLYSGQSLALRPAGRDSVPLFNINLCASTAFLIGNEGQGLSAALIDAATISATIPMPGRVESLNAAACAAIALFEMVRQRQQSQ